MYSFPKIKLPPAFVEAARLQGKEPDVLYCLELLDETGLSCVPGSGFQQKTALTKAAESQSRPLPSRGTYNILIFACARIVKTPSSQENSASLLLWRNLVRQREAQA